MFECNIFTVQPLCIHLLLLGFDLKLCETYGNTSRQTILHHMFEYEAGNLML